MAMVASPSPANPDKTDPEIEEGNPNIRVSPSSDLNLSGAPMVCLVKSGADTAAGALMGSIYGYGAGLLFNKKGFMGSFASAGASAKTFAILSGVHSLVACFMKRIRGKDDIVNAGVAGCCTGLALSFPGAPQALMQSCLTFGAFSFILEGLNKQQTALAALPSPLGGHNNNSSNKNVLASFSLPLPNELKQGFNSFCQSLSKHKKKSPRPRSTATFY
ncbi:hypothetical protein ACHQM5_025681 [Ranunculus cassubicifolius]